MPSFEAGDVVKVPFPYTDRATRQRRPALVVSSGSIEDAHGLLWVLMITSAENRGWPGDVLITGTEKTGLPAPSIIRTAKIATIEARDAERLGKVSAAVLTQVGLRLAAKNRFSEVVERAMTEGPQRVRRRGSDAVVVLSAKEYARLRGPNKSFKEHLMSAPSSLAELDLKRDTSPDREIEL